MSKSTIQPRKPALASLNGKYRLSSDIRKQLNINKVLNIEVKHWCNLVMIIEDYFKNTKQWDENPQHLYNVILDALSKINKCQNCAFNLQTFANSTIQYLQNNLVKLDFFKIYRNQERKKRLEKAVEEALIEGNISGVVLSKNGARNAANIFDEKFQSDKVSTQKSA
jgi:hypothetical protein